MTPVFPRLKFSAKHNLKSTQRPEVQCRMRQNTEDIFVTRCPVQIPLNERSR
jgi:hypothetical protein